MKHIETIGHKLAQGIDANDLINFSNGVFKMRYTEQDGEQPFYRSVIILDSNFVPNAKGKEKMCYVEICFQGVDFVTGEILHSLWWSTFRAVDHSCENSGIGSRAIS